MSKHAQINYRNAEHYGFDKQSNQLMEECAELIQAVNKYKRVRTGEAKKVQNALDNIVEEIADVEVMIQQIMYLLDITTQEVENVKMQKIKRALLRIERELDR